MNACTMAQPKPAPRATPRPTPSSAISRASVSSMPRSCPLVRPSARSRADSLVRSSTDSVRVLVMPSRAMRMASPSSRLNRARIWLTWLASWLR